MSRAEREAPGAELEEGRAVGTGELAYRYRGLLLAPPILAALLLPAEFPLAGWAAGLAAFAAGVALRVWAQEHVRYRTEAAPSLTTTGPYRWTRNPVYLGTILVCVGAVATTGRPWVAVATAAWCAAVYAPVVRFEERHLERRFGGPYRRYRSDVPRWLPRRAGGPPELVNEHLPAALRAESGNLLLLVPFAAKALL